MAAKYIYNKRSRIRRKRALVTAFIAAVIIIGGGYGGLIWVQHQKPKPITAAGKTVAVPQASSNNPTLNISEPTFTMQLPGDWKQIASPIHDPDHPLVWVGTNKTDNARSLTVYIDAIPGTTPVNLELPVAVHNNQLLYGQMSDNCSNFTPGGTNNVAAAEKLPPKQSVWRGVNFICDLPRFIDNQVGTGEPGQPINSLAVSGPKAGPHHYFFLYTDRSIQPDYSAFYEALESFRAK